MRKAGSYFELRIDLRAHNKDCSPSLDWRLDIERNCFMRVGFAVFIV